MTPALRRALVLFHVLMAIAAWTAAVLAGVRGEAGAGALVLAVAIIATCTAWWLWCDGREVQQLRAALDDAGRAGRLVVSLGIGRLERYTLTAADALAFCDHAGGPVKVMIAGDCWLSFRRALSDLAGDEIAVTYGLNDILDPFQDWGRSHA